MRRNRKPDAVLSRGVVHALLLSLLFFFLFFKFSPSPLQLSTCNMAYAAKANKRKSPWLAPPHFFSSPSRAFFSLQVACGRRMNTSRHRGRHRPKNSFLFFSPPPRSFFSFFLRTNHPQSVQKIGPSTTPLLPLRFPRTSKKEEQGERIPGGHSPSPQWHSPLHHEKRR